MAETRNPNSYLVRKSDVFQIAWEMFREHQVDIVTGLGDLALMGKLHAWQDNNQSIDEQFAGDVLQAIIFGEVKTTLAGNGNESSHVEVEVEKSQKVLAGLVPLDFAKDLIVDIVKGSISEVKKISFAAAKKGIEQKLGHPVKFADGRGEKRWEVFQARYASRLRAHRNSAVEKLCAVVLKKHSTGRRRGIQIISTRKENIPFGWSKFSGKDCYRADVGRPALPKGSWLARYRKRRKAQRKDTARKYSMKKRKAIAPPPTKHPRPGRIINLKDNRKIGRKSFYDTTESADQIFAKMEDELSADLANV